MRKKRVYADRKEYLKLAVAKRRKKIREMAITFLGGCCWICGFRGVQQRLIFII